MQTVVRIHIKLFLTERRDLRFTFRDVKYIIVITIYQMLTSFIYRNIKDSIWK